MKRKFNLLNGKLIINNYNKLDKLKLPKMFLCFSELEV